MIHEPHPTADAVGWRGGWVCRVRPCVPANGKGANVISNIFVVGLDDLNEAALLRLPGASQFRFHQLLTGEALLAPDRNVPVLLAAAQRQLDAFDGSIDAIVGYWDFPISMMVPILCARHGLPAASLRSVVACEHKYWSRLEQQKVITEIPAFGLLDESTPVPRLPAHMDFPVWIKPVKSVSSEGAFYVTDAAALATSVGLMQQANARIAKPFEDVLAMLELPPEVEAAGASACIVEEPARGRQFTVEGFVRSDDVTVYGVIDSISYPGRSSFLRYQYPSVLPVPVLDRASDVTARVVKAMGLEHTTFNIEYFWDPGPDRLRLLEINVRHSQSHALLFEMVDGVSNHAHMIDVALAREPHRSHGGGPCAVAAKWFVRHFRDGIVRRIPTTREVAALEGEFPGTVITILARAGGRLSHAIGEDSYSYVLAEIYTGGHTNEDLQRMHDACVTALHFEIDDVPGLDS